MNIQQITDSAVKEFDEQIPDRISLGESCTGIYAREWLHAFIIDSIKNAMEEDRKNIKQSFVEHFFQAGELWFDYNFADKENEERAMSNILEHWNDIIEALSPIEKKKSSFINK